MTTPAHSLKRGSLMKVKIDTHSTPSISERRLGIVYPGNWSLSTCSSRAFGHFLRLGDRGLGGVEQVALARRAYLEAV